MVKGLTKGAAQPKGGKGSKPTLKQALKPDASERVKVTNHRVTGRLTAWKNTYGWIIPDTKINHPQAGSHGGKIYLAQEDVEKDLHEETVSFFVYADSSGLGAMHCIPAKTAPVAKSVMMTPKQPAQPPKHLTSKGVGKTTPVGGKPANGKAAAKEGAKASGKGGKPRGEKPPMGTPPDKDSRTPLDTPPVEGMVVKYSNKVGWIKLEETSEIPEEHKDKLRKGTLYFHASDVDGEEPKVGAQVMCFLYTDSNGLGGETLQVLIQGEGTVPKPEKPEGEEAEKETEKKPKTPKLPAEDRPKKDKGAGKGGKSTKGGKAKGKGKGEKRERGPSGPNLERERITEVQVTGEVLSWTRKFGWLKCEEVDHPSLDKHEGKIYVHQKDLVGIESLEVGSAVSFHVYSDASGLGAEEVEQF